jgi:isoamylase
MQAYRCRSNAPELHGSANSVPQRELHKHVAPITTLAEVRAGSALPLGTQERSGGVNFSLFSRNASDVRLELFDHANDARPSRVIDLTPARHRTGDVWHAWVAGLVSGQLYAYRIDGPYAPGQGFRFNSNRLLLDPFATAVTCLPHWDFASARGYDAAAPEPDMARSAVDNAASSPKCIVLNEFFDWGDDPPLRHPWSKTVIYEMHVRGFTAHSQSGVDHPGTYRGLEDKIPYLKDLGVTAVELMPVQEFNDGFLLRKGPGGELLNNYWGYDPVVFCAPKAPTAARVALVNRSANSSKWCALFTARVNVFGFLLFQGRRSLLKLGMPPVPTRWVAL